MRCGDTVHLISRKFLATVFLIGIAFFLSDCTQNVTVRWQTDVELDIAGFVVYRSPTLTGPWEQASPIIPARGDSIRGAEYAFRDEHPGRARYYRVEVIHLNGAREKYAPIPVDVGHRQWAYLGLGAVVLAITVYLSGQKRRTSS